MMKLFEPIGNVHCQVNLGTTNSHLLTRFQGAAALFEL